VTLIVAGLVATASQLGGQSGATSATPDRRPTLGVWDFETSAIGRDRAADYAPISKSLALSLAAKIGRNPNVRVVTRGDLQKLLDEQNLSASGRVDPSSVVRMGKLTGIKHFVGGSFIVSPKNEMSLTVTVWDAETGVMEPAYTEQVRGNGDDAEDLIEQVGQRLSKSLRLPELPSGSEATAKPSGKRGTLRELVAIGRALQAEDRKEVAQASELWKAFQKSAPQTAFVEVRQYADERLRADVRSPD
jgi:hypothetical protein